MNISEIKRKDVRLLFKYGHTFNILIFKYSTIGNFSNLLIPFFFFNAFGYCILHIIELVKFNNKIKEDMGNKYHIFYSIIAMGVSANGAFLAVSSFFYGEGLVSSIRMYLGLLYMALAYIFNRFDDVAYEREE